MILPRELIDSFISFAESTYGVSVHHTTPTTRRSDEIARFVLGDRLYIVREFSEYHGNVVEVFSSDKDGIRSMEGLWYQIVQQLMEDSSGPTNDSE